MLFLPLDLTVPQPGGDERPLMAEKSVKSQKIACQDVVPAVISCELLTLTNVNRCYSKNETGVTFPGAGHGPLAVSRKWRAHSGGRVAGAGPLARADRRASGQSLRCDGAAGSGACSVVVGMDRAEPGLRGAHARQRRHL